MALTYRIENSSLILMVGTAMIIDTLQLLLGGFFELLLPIPVVGEGAFFFGFIITSLLSVLAWFIFFLWFNKKGVRFFKFGKKQIPSWIARGLEVFIGVLPGWSLAVFLLIHASRKEDKEKAENTSDSLKTYGSRQEFSNQYS